MLVHRASSTTVYRPQFGRVKRNWGESMLPLRPTETAPSPIRQFFTNIFDRVRRFLFAQPQQHSAENAASTSTLPVPAPPQSLDVRK